MLLHVDLCRSREPGAHPDPGVGVETHPEPDPDVDPGADPDPDPDSDPNNDSDPDPVWLSGSANEKSADKWQGLCAPRAKVKSGWEKSRDNFEPAFLPQIGHIWREAIFPPPSLHQQMFQIEYEGH